MFKEFHLLDQHLGLILIYQTFSVPLAVWMFKSFIQEIPIDYEEAALIDGATRAKKIATDTLKSLREVNKTVVRRCDKCGNEDSVDCVSGLCPSCREYDMRGRE